MGNLKSNFSHVFHGKVWNLQFIEATDSLAIEIRDDEAFETTFFMFDLIKMEFTVKELKFDEEWWVGITYATADLILFHTYENQENPDIKEYFLYDVEKDGVLWHRKDLNIVEVNDKVARVKNSVEAHLFINLLSGEQVDQPVEYRPIENKKVINSFLYTDGSKYFKTVSQFLKELIGEDLVYGAEYFQSDNEVIISYYIRNGENLANKLLVVNLNKQILLQETLGENLPGISDNTFFIYDGNLIFVKELNQFFIYPLTKS